MVVVDVEIFGSQYDATTFTSEGYSKNESILQGSR